MAIGPVQLLVVAFDEPHFTGAIVEELNRLRAHDLIRLVDVLVVQKDLDGDVTAVQVSDLSVGEAEQLGSTIGALIGLGLDGEDGMEAGARAGAEAGAEGHLPRDGEMYDVPVSLPAGSAFSLALIEHVWAGPL